MRRGRYIGGQEEGNESCDSHARTARATLCVCTICTVRHRVLENASDQPASHFPISDEKTDFQLPSSPFSEIAIFR